MLKGQREVLKRDGKFAMAQSIENEIEYSVEKSNEERINDVRLRQEQDRENLERDQLEEFEQFNDHWDKLIANHNELTKSKIEAMIEDHKSKRFERLNQLELKIPKEFKKSSELLNMIQIQNGLLKLKEFGEAHKIQKRIESLTAQESRDWEVERRKKINQELSHLDARNEQELNSLKKRLARIDDENKKKRCIDLEVLLQKFQNRKKELQNLQIVEMNRITGAVLILSPEFN